MTEIIQLSFRLGSSQKDESMERKYWILLFALWVWSVLMFFVPLGDESRYKIAFLFFMLTIPVYALIKLLFPKSKW